MPKAFPSPIEHVVVLMLENRSFDHILGFLPRQGHLSGMEGLTGNEFNFINPFRPSSDRYYVQEGALYAFEGHITSDGPPHTFRAANKQLTGSFGGPTPEYPARNNGFVLAFVESLREQSSHPASYWAPPDQIKPIMQCFSPSQVPAISTLAREFVLCDHWFSSVPGVTMPNRFYVHAATSGGYAINDGSKSYGFRTLYNNLDDAGLTWRCYYEDVNELFLLNQIRVTRSLFRKFGEHFQTDVSRSDVPNYTFIIPRFNDAKASDGHIIPANAEHAPADVRPGEQLIAQVYNALRANPEIWRKCLLVVLYDEHGGFYDHVIPPVGVPNPDGINSPTPDQAPGSPYFTFQRLGFRVPAILASPWLPRSLNTTHYEHASIPATIKQLFGLKDFLTERDCAANSFEHLLTGASGFREDTPKTLPTPVQHEAPRRLFAQTRAAPMQALTTPLLTGESERELTRGIFLREPDPRRRQELLARLEAGLHQHEAAALIQQVTDRFIQQCESHGGVNPACEEVRR